MVVENIDIENLPEKLANAYDKIDNEERNYINQMLDIFYDKNSSQVEKERSFNTILDGFRSYLSDEEYNLLCYDLGKKESEVK